MVNPMRSLLIAGFMLAAGLAGCLGTSEDVTLTDDDGTGNGSPGPSPGPTTSPSPTPTAAPNTPPSANLTLSASNGTAPLNVTFSIDGSDADGDALTWSLDLGEGNSSQGDELPAEVTHAFTVEGNFTVTLRVSDGQATAVSSRLVVVHAPDAVPAAPLEDDYVIFNADGTCTAKDAISIGPIWIHDRPGDSIPFVGENPLGDSWPTGTGFFSGRGTWVYEESNGIDGLQVGGKAPTGDPEVAEYADCANPDTLII